MNQSGGRIQWGLTIWALRVAPPSLSGVVLAMALHLHILACLKLIEPEFRILDIAIEALTASMVEE